MKKNYTILPEFTAALKRYIVMVELIKIVNYGSLRLGG